MKETMYARRDWEWWGRVLKIWLMSPSWPHSTAAL